MSHGLDTVGFFVVTLSVHLSPRRQISRARLPACLSPKSGSAFRISLLGDPVMLDFNGEHLLKVKKALPAIPTARGFSPSERSLYFRWQWAAENGWTREKNGKAIKLKRVSETTLKGRYESGLNAFWKFAIEHWFAYGPVSGAKRPFTRFPPSIRSRSGLIRLSCGIVCAKLTDHFGNQTGPTKLAPRAIRIN